MRLIDADEFIISLNDFSNKTFSTGLCASLIELFPTAYDVNRVVEELENSKKSIIGRYDSSVPMSEMPSRKLEYNKGIDKAIEIVKAGGMNE